MGTRYVWRKKTYTEAYLNTPIANAGPSISLGTDAISSIVIITLCTSYTAGLNSYGKPDIVPSGNQITIAQNGNFTTGSWPTSTYNYAVVHYPSDDMNQPYLYEAKNTSQYWRMANKTSGSGYSFFISSSSTGTDVASPSADVRDLVSKGSTTKISSSSSSAYPTSNQYVNSIRAEVTYLGSDNIDPTDVSYSQTSITPGSSVTVNVTPRSNTYGGTISYLYQYSTDNGSTWTDSGTATTNTSKAITVPSSATQFKVRVRAQDNMGFTSTTYVTGKNLTLQTYTVSLSVSPYGSGSTSGAGTYASGASVSVTATPSTGYQFSHWLEGSTQVGTSSTYSFTVSGNKSLTAVFSKISYTISASVSPSASGSVSGTGTYNYGDTVSLTATASSGYQFVGWYDGSTLVSTSSTYSFTVSGNKSFTVQFQVAVAPQKNNNVYLGISNVAREIKNIYVGVNGVARKVVNGYIGVNGVARPFYSAGQIIKDLIWKEATLPNAGQWKSITYGDGKFVAPLYYSSTVAYSTDGINWSAASLPSSSNWISIAYGSGTSKKFVAIAYGSNKAAYSTDGVNWTAATLPYSAGWKSIAWGNNKFVAVAEDSDEVIYSQDGVEWYTNTLPFNAYWSSAAFGTVAFGTAVSSRFVAVSEASNKATYSINVFTDWIETEMPLSADWYSVTCGNRRFVAVARYSNKSAYSTDGINWTESTLPSNDSWSSVTYGGGKFVAVGGSSIASSADGITWTPHSPPSDIGIAKLNGVTYGNGKFVAVLSTTNKCIYALE